MRFILGFIVRFWAMGYGSGHRCSASLTTASWAKPTSRLASDKNPSSPDCNGLGAQGSESVVLAY